MTTLLIAIILVGWVAAALIGTQAYFRGEQTKLCSQVHVNIHSSNR